MEFLLGKLPRYFTLFLLYCIYNLFASNILSCKENDCIEYIIRSYEFGKKYYIAAGLEFCCDVTPEKLKIDGYGGSVSVFCGNDCRSKIDIRNAFISRIQTLYYNMNRKKITILMYVGRDDFEEYVTCSVNNIAIDGCESISSETILLFDDVPSYREKMSISKAYILVILFLSIICGLLLNFMPCCLPLLSVKIYGIVSGKTSKMDSIYYAIGACITFMSIALYTSLTRSMWGSLMQNSSFVSLVLVIFFVSAMHFFDILKIQNKRLLVLSSSLFIILIYLRSNNLKAMSKLTVAGLTLLCLLAAAFQFKKKFMFITQHVSSKSMSNILHGAMSSINATICTGPLIGSAIGAGLNMEVHLGLLIFFMISVGFVAPIIVVSALPSCRKIIPKPGDWLIAFKRLNGIMMLAACLWIVNIIVIQLGENIFLSVSFVLLACATSCILQASRKIYIQIIANIVMCFSCYTLMNPSILINRFDVPVIYEYNKNSIRKDLDSGKMVLLTFTSEFCLNCKYNYVFFSNKDVIKFLAKNNIVVMKCDITKPNDEMQDLMNSLGISSVPYNILFTPDGNREVLPEILTKSIIYNKKYWRK